MHLVCRSNELVTVQGTYRTEANIARKKAKFPPQYGRITIQAIDCDRKTSVSFPSVIHPPIPPSGYHSPLTGAVRPFITGYFLSWQVFFLSSAFFFYSKNDNGWVVVGGGDIRWVICASDPSVRVGKRACVYVRRVQCTG
jgi:hypothetical protein